MDGDEWGYEVPIPGTRLIPHPPRATEGQKEPRKPWAPHDFRLDLFD